jgi:large repetitive protein
MRQRLRSRHGGTVATLVSLAVILALVGVALVALTGAKAAGQGQPQCGDTITTDTTLHHDLVDCPNNGIIIGADDVTLDLNYHTIDGDGTPAAGCDPETEFCDEGIIDLGHDGVTVTHGSVRDFAAGAEAGRARHIRFLGISASRNFFDGLGVFESTRILVRNSSGNGSLTRDGGVGLAIFSSRHVRILHNSIRRNADEGMFIFDSTHTLIKGNLLSRNKGDEGAIALLDSDRNVVRHNRASRNSSGIGIEGNRNIIRRNRINRSRGFGIPLAHGDHNLIARNSIRDTGGFAISVGFEPGAGNVVRRNRIRGAGELAGRGFAYRPRAGVLVDSRGKRTLVVGNVIRGGAEDGIHVRAKAKRTRLKGNHAFGAKDDGIDVGNPKTKLTRNEARRNGDLGIEAVRGVRDGGGNKASGNGDPRQCTNIVCR